MTPLSTILFLCLVAVLAVFFVIFSRRQNESLRRVQAEEDAILAEERRLFRFLHDLGEALTAEDRKHPMHRLIVEGAQRVTHSVSGAIYLLDESGRSLVPKFCSDECPPLIKVPERIVAMAKENPTALLSFLRLHAVDKEAALLGAVFSSQMAEMIPNLKREQRLESGSNPLHPPVAAMISPLSCGGRKLGILAVADPVGRAAFNENDFEVFRSLAEQSAFALANEMVRHEAQAKQQIEAELRAASAIQRILLPDQDPKMHGFAIAGQNIPARVLSGDFYDFIELGEGRLGVVIADVSGKGTSAALISAMCRAMVHCLAPGQDSPAKVLTAVNRQLFPDIREDMFVTMTYMILDSASHEVVFCRAGHTAPMVWRKEGGFVENLTSPGMVIGIDRGDVFERVARDVRMNLSIGDVVLLYTDGVSEASDSKELIFGEERLERELALRAHLGPQAVIQGVMEEVDEFVGGQRSLDDITLIALQKTP